MQTPSTQQNIIDRLFGWWYAIAAPSAPLGNISRRQSSSLRKGRYTSLVLLIELVDTFLAYFVKTSPQLIISLTIGIFILCIGVYLNHLGRTMAAGWIVVIITEASMIAYILSLALLGPGLPMSALPMLIVLLQPQLIAISLFPPKISLSIMIFNCMFIAAVIVFTPKSHEMIAYLATETYDTYYTYAGTLIFVSLISLLWANGALREMNRADNSEEVSKLARDIMNNPVLLRELLKRVEREGMPFQNVSEEEARYQSNNDGLW